MRQTLTLAATLIVVAFSALAQVPVALTYAVAINGNTYRANTTYLDERGSYIKMIDGHYESTATTIVSPRPGGGIRVVTVDVVFKYQFELDANELYARDATMIGKWREVTLAPIPGFVPVTGIARYRYREEKNGQHAFDEEIHFVVNGQLSSQKCLTVVDGRGRLLHAACDNTKERVVILRTE